MIAEVRAIYPRRRWCEVDGVVRLSLEGGSGANATGRSGRSGGVREREESTAPDVWLPRTEPSKPADGGGGDLFIFILWSSGERGKWVRFSTMFYSLCLPKKRYILVGVFRLD